MAKRTKEHFYRISGTDPGGLRHYEYSVSRNGAVFRASCFFNSGYTAITVDDFINAGTVFDMDDIADFSEE